MAEEKAVSFADDIRPMFREIDVDHMRGFGVLLDDYAYMSQHDNAEQVLRYLDGTIEPQMPPHGPFWTKEQLEMLSRWITGGCQP
jgi:hypothetical protein